MTAMMSYWSTAPHLPRSACPVDRDCMRRMCRSQVLVDQIFERLLAARAGLGLEALLQHVVRQIRQAQLAAEDALTEMLLPPCVTLVDHVGELTVGEHALGHEQRARQCV